VELELELELELEFGVWWGGAHLYIQCAVLRFSVLPNRGTFGI
jgi:hypothetical protein